MRLNKKSLIIGIISGGLLFGSIGVLAATYFSASEVSFTPTDTSWNVSTVQEAIDDLYEVSNTNNGVFSDITTSGSGQYSKYYSSNLLGMSWINYASSDYTNSSINFTASTLLR